jgi:hypothetical protein
MTQVHLGVHPSDMPARGFAPDPFAELRALRGGVGGGEALDGG